MINPEQGKRPVMLVAGEGGHLAQAKRFASRIYEEAAGLPVVLVTEETGTGMSFEGELIIRRNLSRPSKYRTPATVAVVATAFLVEFFSAPLLLLRTKPCGLVAFGPLFCLPICICARIFGIKVVYVETWSRFYRKSHTGRAMQFLANRIYYQNVTLRDQFKGAIYGGRL